MQPFKLAYAVRYGVTHNTVRVQIVLQLAVTHCVWLGVQFLAGVMARSKINLSYILD
jgi:hypothetical protein